MKRTFLIIGFLIFLFACLWAGAFPSAAAEQETPETSGLQELRLRVSFTAEVSPSPVSGRIIIGFHRDPSAPIDNPDLLDPQPTFAWDVRGWKPGEAIILEGRDAVCRHGDLSALDGWYGVQASLKANRMARTLQAPGNARSVKNVVFIEKGRMSRPLDLLIHVPAGPAPEFKESEFIKEANVPSPRLTRFYGKAQSIRAAVILPPGYFQNPERRYPSVYVMGGWGSSPLDALGGALQKRYGIKTLGGRG